MIKIVQVFGCLVLFGIVLGEKFQCSLTSTAITNQNDQQNTCSFIQYRRPYTIQDKIIATKTQKGVASSGTYNIEFNQQPVVNIHLPLYFYGGQNLQSFDSAYVIPEISSTPANIGFYPWSYPTPMKFETNLIPKANNILPWVQSQTVSTIIPSTQILKNQTQIRSQVSIPSNQLVSNTISLPTQFTNVSSSTLNSNTISTINPITNNLNVSQLPTINFPPPSLNFSIIPNLSNLNTTANTSSFSYTAPLNLSATLSSQNSNSSIIQTSVGYSNLSSINPNADFTFISINSSLVNPSSNLTSITPNISSISNWSTVNSPATIPYTSIDDFSSSLLNLSPTPPQYKPNQQIITTPLLGIGQNVNLSGFLNATDLAILGCDQYGNC